MSVYEITKHAEIYKILLFKTMRSNEKIVRHDWENFVPISNLMPLCNHHFLITGFN